MSHKNPNFKLEGDDFNSNENPANPCEQGLSGDSGFQTANEFLKCISQFVLTLVCRKHFKTWGLLPGLFSEIHFATIAMLAQCVLYAVTQWAPAVDSVFKSFLTPWLCSCNLCYNRLGQKETLK